MLIELFDDADTELDSLQFDYKIDSSVPHLTVTGGLPYYEKPLQVFLSGSEDHGLQHPQVTIQNPIEYMYIVEWWCDINNNLVIDEGEWIKESAFEDKTTSESEFDLSVHNFPIGLFRVKIDGTDYVSNNFYVIFNPFDSLSELPFETRIEYLANYWVDEYTGATWAHMSRNVKTNHHEEELLLAMASTSKKGWSTSSGSLCLL